MDVVYGSNEVAKEVTTWLRQVAVELKSADQLHLPDFLDVNPRAQYEEWRDKLAQKRSKIKNADEGTADAQEQLCQTLTKEFKAKKDWRGLLNRLGRMQIEAAVAGLARRKPGPDILRSAYATHLHMLEFIVGAPDAAKVVGDVFREKNLKIPREPEPVSRDTEMPDQRPKPASQPKPKPAPALPPVAALEPTPRPVVSKPVVETEAPPQGGGSFWGRLGGALVSAFAEHLDRRMDELKDAAENEQRLVAQTPNISGEWYSPNGGVFSFSQLGSAVRVQGSAPGISLEGRGQIRGKSVQVEGFSLGSGPFRAGLAVSADGNRMSGQIVDSFGRAAPVELHR